MASPMIQNGISEGVQGTGIDQGMLQRALFTRIQHLESQHDADTLSIMACCEGMKTLCDFMFPANAANPAPTPADFSYRISQIIEELKRRGIANGKTE